MDTFLDLILEKPKLTQEEAKDAMQRLMRSHCPVKTAAFLSFLKQRGLHPEEIAGMQQALEEKTERIDLAFPVLDIVGTGGDGAQTVNISTGACILAAACGIPVVKHGNRSVSSQCGSADVLEALGISIEVPQEEVSRSLEEAGIAFLFAPYYHPHLKRFRSVRKALGFPTLFNLLGPLLNPARAEYALIGVSELAVVELMALSLAQLKRCKRALVFHGSGLDELTTLGHILAYEICDGTAKRLEIDPQALGFSTCTLQDLQGGGAALNAELLQQALSGKYPNALADALVLNAGAALYIFERASSLQEGVAIAQAVLREGKALEVLDKWARFKPVKEQSYLDRIIAAKQTEVDALLASRGTKFAHVLKQGGLSVIGEIKRRSPSRGALQQIPDPVELALKYCKGGAAAISVLTDAHFDGTPDDLTRVSHALKHAYPDVAILRKDFIIHPAQLSQSAAIGADAVLLIAKLLGPDLRSFLLEAERLGLETLTEVHDAEDLALALEAQAPIIGINHRNLSTFEMDMEGSSKLRPLIPASVITVAESGIFTASDAHTMQKLGFDAVLVGEALVRAEDPALLIAQMKGVTV